MPRPHLAALQAVAPWLACGVAAVALLVLLSGCGSTDPNAWRQPEEHPAGGAWYATWEQVPAHTPGGKPLYAAKILSDTDEALIVLVDYPQELATGPLGGDETNPFPAVYGFRCRLPLDPGPATGMEFDWKTLGERIDPPCGVLLYEIENGRARLGFVW
jgi:hypothetical protein